MKAKKIFGVIIVLSVVAVIASTVALNTSNVDKYEMQFSDIKGVHSTEYTIDLIKGPDDGQIDTPVQGISDKGPDDGQIDTPVQGIYEKGPDDGQIDTPIQGIG